ncbi:MAG: uncharacterized lipoprotein YddW (UPF0748 family) [Phycisphaerales bacterium]|jgi:uncharacterized lipoprotein YddW (UPF0748 family)
MTIARLLAFLFSLIVAQTACSVGPDQITSRSVRSGELHGMWVTRWDYLTAGDVKDIMANCQAIGTTDVFWQVRGQADAYYPSDLEPWGEHLFRSTEGGSHERTPTPEEVRRGPGYDPLAVAVKEAHARGMRLHAWVNAMPMWKGTRPPADPTHVWHTRPDLRLKDLDGTPQPLTDHYVIFNPVLDASQDHLVAVLKDLSDRYDIDGVHLDYIRFVSELIDKSKLYPGDATSRALYTAQTGRPFTNTPEGLAPYRDWVRDRITRLVTRIHDEVIRAEPGRVLTAAVWRRPDLAQDYLQDAEAWLQLGLIDAAMPMIYTDKDEQYDSDLKAWLAVPGVRSTRIVPGLGSYKHPSGVQTVRQIRSGPNPDRYVLFAYSTYFDSRAPDQDQSAQERRLREAHRLPLIRTVEAGG